MNTSFSAWKEGARCCGPVLILGAALTAGLWPLGYGWAGLPVLGLGLCMLLFFRDFPRRIDAAPEEVVSPADGTIVGIEDLEESPHYDGPTRRVSIFLSILNAHVNRAPFDGEVQAITYQPGQFKTAMRAETSEINEANTIRLDTPAGSMTVRQIAGIVARRIVCRVETGATLAKGEKFGMIRFGSRTELYLPPGTEVCVRLKAKVKAGTSVIARMS